MKAYHWPSVANNSAFHKAKKDLDAAVKIAKGEWARQVAYDCMGYRTDPIKAWKAMRTLEKGLQHHHSPCRTIQMRKPDGSKVLTDGENAKIF
eukprot:11026108-Ditylum_brightwellii.AAC.1